MHARKLENIVPDGHTNANIIENERETGFRFILPKAFSKTTKAELVSSICVNIHPIRQYARKYNTCLPVHIYMPFYSTFSLLYKGGIVEL